MIGIIDYGMGNIHSVQKALQSFGEDTLVVKDPQEMEQCRKLVLPGVGAFDDAAKELNSRGFVPRIKAQIAEKKPFLGICLGMQLLFDESQEARSEKGLGLVRGEVKMFTREPGYKVPHMGWNQLKIAAAACPLLKDVADKSHVYFCHSFYVEPAQPGVIAATTEYGINFTSVIWQDNLFGVQFHPEKSQETGLKMIKNFVEL
jgi:glutamine amidotransferase